MNEFSQVQTFHRELQSFNGKFEHVPWATIYMLYSILYTDEWICYHYTQFCSFWLFWVLKLFSIQSHLSHHKGAEFHIKSSWSSSDRFRARRLSLRFSGTGGVLPLRNRTARALIFLQRSNICKTSYKHYCLKDSDIRDQRQIIIAWLFVPMRRLSRQHPRNLLAASHNISLPHFHLQIPTPTLLSNCVNGSNITINHTIHW
jgi:hypothetical protein